MRRRRRTTWLERVDRRTSDLLVARKGEDEQEIILGERRTATRGIRSWVLKVLVTDRWGRTPKF